MLRLARIFAFLVIILSAMVLLYGGYSVALTRYLTKAMTTDTEIPVKFTRVKPFFDGAVIDTIHLGKDITLSTVYFESYPWDMLRNRVKHIYIKEAKIYDKELFEKPLIWPFLHSIPLTVENILFTTTMMGRPITFNGEMKQSPDIPLLFKLKSASSEMDLNLQGEIRVQHEVIQSIDVEFYDAQTSFPAFETKRSTGWLSLTYDQNIWNIVGEIDFGSVQIPQQSFFDMTVKLSGVFDKIEYSAAAKDRETGQIWVIEHRNKGTDIRYRDQLKTIAPEKMNALFAHKLGSLMTTFSVNDTVEKLLEEKPIKEKQIEDKPPKNIIIPSDKPALQQDKPIENSALPEHSNQTDQDVDTDTYVENVTQETELTTDQAERIIYVPIDDLIENSIFAGFLYERHLVFMPRICVNQAETECWVARGQGGTFSYDADDPWKVPSYFSRLSDYREATKLRGLLQSVTITSLVLSGHQGGVQDMIVQGYDMHGQPLYIELSLVESVND